MNPYAKGNNAYKKASVNTTDQGTLILMLYDGTIRFLKVAITKLEEKDLEAAHKSISKAKNIISELLSSLDTDKGGNVGQNLHQLYTYMYNRLIDANVQKDLTHLVEVRDLMLELRDGWVQITKGKQKTAGKPVMPSRTGAKPFNLKG